MASRGDLRIYRAFSFRSGLDVKTSPLDLSTRKAQDRLTLARHMEYPTRGGVSKRRDWESANTSSLGASVVITGGIQFRHSDGTDYHVVGTNDGRLVLINSDGTTTNLATGLTTGRRWSFAVYNDKLICCNGADAPRKYDGTSVATLGGSPPSTGSVVVAHGNRVFMLDETQKSRVSWCALNNEEDWTAANNAGSLQVKPNDGSNAVGLVPSINELIILKGTRPYRLQGTNPSTFASTDLLPTTGSVGAISPQANGFALNDVWYLSSSGVHNLATVQQFGDLKESFASERIAPYFEPNSDYTVTLQNLSNGVGVYDSQQNRLLFGVDSDGDGQNDLMLVLDLYSKAWATWPGLSIASLWLARNSTNGRMEVWMGGYDGVVRILARAVSANAINASARHISCLNAPGVEKSPRYGFFYFQEAGNHSVTIDTKFDFGATGGQTYAASLLGGSHTLGVNWVLGTDALGAKDQIVKRIDLSGIGEYLEVGVTNANAGQAFTWLGYEIMWRPRRVIRRAT